MGYEQFSISFQLDTDTLLNVKLSERVDQLAEVVVEGDRYSNEDLLGATSSGTHRLTTEDIKKIPAFMGEADIIKSIQLMPGTVRGVEGSSDVFVRGGAADQNLVLLDGAPVYNTSHLFGFLSVFNPDVVENVEAINGGFPAEFGGRLSSVLNVNTLGTVPDRTQISGDVGLIASRLKIEQPIIKDKASLWVAGRRTYVDQVVKLIDENVPYYFYDLNGKFILTPSKSDKIEISHYSGEDVLDFFRDKNSDGQGMLTTYNMGNINQSLRWTRMNRNNWSHNISLFRTKFNYHIKNAFEDYSVAAFSEIEDHGAKMSVSKDSVWNGTFSTGAEWIRHNVSPNVVNSVGSITHLVESSSADGKIADEYAAYVQHDWSLSKNLRMNLGVRGSMAVVGDKKYIYPEPRFSARYDLGKNNALKFNYSRMVQYMHRVSNSGVSTPTDLWYPVTDSIRPQTSHQFSLALQKFAPENKIFVSVEGYYKTMENLIAYEEGTNLLFNTDFESRLIQGQGEAYGLEFLVKKDAGKLTGWVSYTLSWSWRQYDEINNGEWFRARYDRRHNGAIVAQYAFAKRWAASMIWEFLSGARFTPVIGQYVTLAPNVAGLDLVPIFSDINSVKLADSHRLDVGIKYFSKESNRFRWHCFAGVYNAYNRASPIGIVVEQDEETGVMRYAQPGLFGLLPFISCGFKL